MKAVHGNSNEGQAFGSDDTLSDMNDAARKYVQSALHFTEHIQREYGGLDVTDSTIFDSPEDDTFMDRDRLSIHEASLNPQLMSSYEYYPDRSDWKETSRGNPWWKKEIWR